MSDSQPQTKSSAPLNTLDSYISSSKLHTSPQPIATSAEIRDRGSTFIANIFSATSPEQAKAHAKYVKQALHGNKKATHEIAAWRCMAVKPGCTGLGGPEEFEVASGSIDDGERWAGDRALKVMVNLAVIDAVVVVSRWYGGTLLGPSRFDHIETCTAEVCRAFKRSEELRESIATLETLDVLLEGLREELVLLQQETAVLNPSGSESQSPPLWKAPPVRDAGEPKEKKKPDYSSIDLAKTRRLIKARENAIKWVKESLNAIRNPITSSPDAKK
ncbi:ribosomal protein S5 domain 2-like protein [Macrolepiota fuliginosa MF-IS2]|uniref:Ribosomal protein S5 domain 2-like protein n=1 Tax=Macrolepiota fuliginosa MF-IS2 TaxID=1400762 RepID=A0A9P6C485_9AGAR|nr:ribosomal protein S5 domain 2-like protein [Macrolepiota fuliginosa MF-IS2]